MAHEISELNQIRLEADLSVQQLADDIEFVTGHRIERSALHRLLYTPGREPRDRTLHKIRQYLEEQRRAPKRRRARNRVA